MNITGYVFRKKLHYYAAKYKMDSNRSIYMNSGHSLQGISSKDERYEACPESAWTCKYTDGNEVSENNHKEHKCEDIQTGNL